MAKFLNGLIQIPNKLLQNLQANGKISIALAFMPEKLINQTTTGLQAFPYAHVGFLYRAIKEAHHYLIRILIKFQFSPKRSHL